MTHPATQYALDVVEGRIVTGELVGFACQRHLDDLETSRRDLAYPFYFDEDAANLVLDFCPLCHHFEGEWAGQVFEPAPWQVLILGSLFGWLHRADFSRRFRKAFVMVARKNGKTLFAAVVGFYVLLQDGEPGAQVDAHMTDNLLRLLVEVNFGVDAPVPHWFTEVDDAEDLAMRQERADAMLDRGLPLPLEDYYRINKQRLPRAGESIVRSTGQRSVEVVNPPDGFDLGTEPEPAEPELPAPPDADPAQAPALPARRFATEKQFLRDAEPARCRRSQRVSAGNSQKVLAVRLSDRRGLSSLAPPEGRPGPARKRSNQSSFDPQQGKTLSLGERAGVR